MAAVMGAIGVAAVTVGTLAASVGAGMMLLQVALRALEAAIPARSAATVADFGTYVRRSTGPLAPAGESLERAA